MKMKILLLNLPLAEFYEKYQRGNHQIFQNYIEILCKKNNIENVEIIKLDREITDLYNNKKIIEKIIDVRPHIVGFSSYLWNIERNIFIAEKLKKYGIITIAGGPEVQKDNINLIDNPAFDILISGEGENILLSILKSLKNPNTLKELKEVRFIESQELTDINVFVEEYSEISEDFKKDNLCYIEVERGCPFSCSFCAYGKTRNKIGEIDRERFQKVFTQFINRGANEFYILSPTLNRNGRNFRNLLLDIIDIKKETNGNIKLFGELRAETLTLEDMLLLKEAGFDSIEFGIQSLNSDTLKSLNVRRKDFDIADFTNKLLENKITPIIDFIVGLPGDDYNTIIKSIDKLSKNNLLDYCNFYHLQLLPGTDIKNMFIRNNFKFQQTTPYFALQTDKMNIDDIRNVYLYLEQEKGISYRDNFIPNDKERFYLIKTESDFTKLYESVYYQTSSLIMLDNFSEEQILDFFTNFFKNNPEIFHISYIFSEKIITDLFLEKLKIIFLSYSNYYDNYRMSINYFNDESFSKVFNILCRFDVNNKYLEHLRDYYSADYIFFPNDIPLLRKNIKRLKELESDEDINSYIFMNMDFNDDFLIKLPCDWQRQ